MDRDGYFTARDLADFIFCSRSLYFHYCIKAGKERTPKMEKGLEVHESISDKAKRARVVKELPALRKEFGLRLYSEKHGFGTVIDCILLNNGEAYPVEFKFSKSRGFIFRTHKYQMVAQAIVIEEVLEKRVPLGYLKYSDGSTAKLEISQKLKEEVAETFKEMEKVIKLELIPKTTKFKKRCAGCFYKNICRRQ